jgi:hypothetical protein
MAEGDTNSGVENRGDCIVCLKRNIELADGYMCFECLYKLRIRPVKEHKKRRNTRERVHKKGRETPVSFSLKMAVSYVFQLIGYLERDSIKRRKLVNPASGFSLYTRRLFMVFSFLFLHCPRLLTAEFRW